MSELDPHSAANAMSDDAFFDLAIRYLDGTLSGDELLCFQVAMESDVAKAHSFVDTCLIGKLFAESLRLDLRSEGLLADPTDDFALSRSPLLASGVGPSSSEPPSSPMAGFLSQTFHHSTGYFSSGWPVAYLMAAVICGVGILIGTLVHVSSPVQLVQHSPSTPSSPAPSPSSLLFVGRITGMVDCQWADPNTAVAGPVAVPLGRKYALSSGLLEITYNTGAKVILQGPATYEVESAASGFLSVGKLTARIDKKEEQRTKNEELPASRSSFLIPTLPSALPPPPSPTSERSLAWKSAIRGQLKHTCFVAKSRSSQSHAAANVAKLSDSLRMKRSALSETATAKRG